MGSMASLGLNIQSYWGKLTMTTDMYNMTTKPATDSHLLWHSPPMTDAFFFILFAKPHRKCSLLWCQDTWKSICLSLPPPLPPTSQVVASLSSRPIVRVCCGAQHALARTATGLLWAWGCNEHGQLGLGDLKPRFRPEQVWFWEIG